jgi:hypothetical protein
MIDVLIRYRHQIKKALSTTVKGNWTLANKPHALITFITKITQITVKTMFGAIFRKFSVKSTSYETS